MALNTGIFAGLIEEERNKQTERRSSLENPQTPLSFPAEWLLDNFNGGRTDAGVRVSELSAFSISTFLACTDLISKSIASLPVNIFERSFMPSGRKVNRPAYDHDLVDLFTEPNEDMSWNTFMQAYMLHALVWGNGYSEIQRDKSNNVVGLWPRTPSKTRPKLLTQAVTLPPVPWRPFPVSLQAGEMVFETTDGVSGLDLSELGASSPGATRIIAKQDMLHLQGLSFDGRCAQSLVWLAREILGMALATNKFSAKYFANFAKPPGILELPANIGPQDKEQTRRSWQEAQGGENMLRTAVVSAGVKYTSIANNPQDSQMIETRKNIVIEIATMFHVPPHMVGDTSATKSTTEQQGQEFLTICLQPWLSAIKTEFKRKLFPNPTIAATGRKPKKNAFFIDFDLHNLLRPTAADREAYYKTMFGIGAFCLNDVLELEGRNPLDFPEAEKHYIPVNMQDIENPVVTADNPQHPNDPNKPSGTADVTDPTEEQPTTADPAEQQPKQDPDAEINSLFPVYFRLFRDAVGRVLTREKRDTKAFQRTFEPVLFAIADTISTRTDSTLRTGDALPADTAKFVKDFIGGLEKRAANWSQENADEQAAAELRRALKAIHTSFLKTLELKAE
jgi:HK97 family phage portal protein